MSVSTFEEITKTKPEKSLVVKLKNTPVAITRARLPRAIVAVGPNALIA